MDEQEIIAKFYNMINQEDWSDEAYTGTDKLNSVVMSQFITLPTPHPHFFINLTFEYEYNPELGDDLYGK